MFTPVSLAVPSSRSPGAKAQMGGFAPRRLKKLNGAAFTLPSALMLVTSAIGRGVTRLARSGYARSANSFSRLSSINGSGCELQSGNVCAVHAIGKRQQLALGLKDKA